MCLSYSVRDLSVSVHFISRNKDVTEVRIATSRRKSIFHSGQIVQNKIQNKI